MAAIIKDLGAVTAYAYAVEQGYTGTEEEFAELMASYADVAEDAAESAAAAEQAKEDAVTAKTAAEAAAATATTKASAAATSADAASSSASTATTAATTATTKAGEATTAATTATAKATEAAASAATATTAASEAADSADAAAVSEEQAEEAADYIVTHAEKLDGIEEEIYKVYPTETVIGDIVTISDGAEDIPVKALTVAVEPVQDLHGQDAPYPAGGSVNKLPLNAENNTYTSSGVTLTVKDGVYTLSGTATAGVNFVVPLASSVDLSPSTNKIAFLNTQAVNVSVGFRRGSSQIHYWTMSPVNRVASGWTAAEDETIEAIQISMSSGVNTNGLVFKPMLIDTSIADPTTFIPNANICPITGWDAVNVVRTGKNLLDMKGLNHTSGTVTAMTFLKKGTYYVYQFSGSSAHNTSFYYSLDGTNKTIIPTTDDGYAVAALSSVSYNRQKNMITLHQDCYFALSILGNASIGENPIDVMVTTDGTGYDSFPNNAGSLAYKDSMYKPYVSTTYPIPLPSTVYGGTLDVKSGVMTVDRALVDLGTLTWTAIKTGGEGYFMRSVISDAKHASAASAVAKIVCESYKAVSYNTVYNGDVDAVIAISASNHRVCVYDSRYNGSDSATAFKTAVDGVHLAYELETPYTITLDPTTISTLLGNNTIYADAGQVTVAYRADVGLYIDKRIAEVQALVLES